MPPYTKSLDDILNRPKSDDQPHYNYRCTIGAHRGASEEFRENTLAALVAADKDERFAFIELDVQYSKDNKIVVYHDKRMLRLFGSLKAVGDATYDELNQISRGEIASYDEVIEGLSKKLNIEIKSRGDQQEDERLVNDIMADIYARHREKDILLSSISQDVVKYINLKYPGVPTGQIYWMTSSTYLHLDILTKNLYEALEDSQADYLILYVANLNNIDDLLKYKPWRKTIVFWDFDDTIFIVHKDLSDRLWGESGISTFFQFLRFKFLSLFTH